jgi:hypothetical protein
MRPPPPHAPDRLSVSAGDVGLMMPVPALPNELRGDAPTQREDQHESRQSERSIRHVEPERIRIAPVEHVVPPGGQTRRHCGYTALTRT